MTKIEIIKALELLKKERSIHATINKSEYEENCLDTVISMLNDEFENLMQE